VLRCERPTRAMPKSFITMLDGVWSHWQLEVPEDFKFRVAAAAAARPESLLSPGPALASVVCDPTRSHCQCSVSATENTENSLRLCTQWKLERLPVSGAFKLP
jgi:hypothetical protein